MTQAAIGGPAQTTYRVTDRALVTGRDAQRVFVVADGRPQEGGPQQAVYYVSDAEIAAGDFVKGANKPIPIIEVGAAGAEYPPIAVYVVTANSESDFPPTPEPPAPVPPQFVSAEIGNVDNTTIVVTFDMDVSAPENDFLMGVVVNVNGLLTVTTSGIRQSNHAIVWYAITTPVAFGDTVTWNYSDTTGLIVSEADGAPLADVAQASVTNNVAPSGPTLLLDLEADALVLSDGDPVSTWADQSGNGRDFTASGTARPTKQTIDTYPVVIFDGVNDWMLGPDFCDNPSSMTIFFVTLAPQGEAINGPMLMKIGNDQCSDPGCTGWTTYGNASFNLDQNTNNLIYQQNANSSTVGRHITSFEMVSVNELHTYADGVLTDLQAGGGRVVGTGVTNFSNSEPVRLGADGTGVGSCDPASKFWYFAIRIYSPAPNATQRAAIEAELATRYGITL